MFQDYTTWTVDQRGIRFGIATEEKQLRNPSPADPTKGLEDHQGMAYDVVLYGNYLQPRPLVARGIYTQSYICLPSSLASF